MKKTKIKCVSVSWKESTYGSQIFPKSFTLRRKCVIISRYDNNAWKYNARRAFFSSASVRPPLSDHKTTHNVVILLFRAGQQWVTFTQVFTLTELIQERIAECSELTLWAICQRTTTTSLSSCRTNYETRRTQCNTTLGPGGRDPKGRSENFSRRRRHTPVANRMAKDRFHFPNVLCVVESGLKDLPTGNPGHKRDLPIIFHRRNNVCVSWLCEMKRKDTITKLMSKVRATFFRCSSDRFYCALVPLRANRVRNIQYKSTSLGFCIWIGYSDTMHRFLKRTSARTLS